MLIVKFKVCFIIGFLANKALVNFWLRLTFLWMIFISFPFLARLLLVFTISRLFFFELHSNFTLHCF